MAMGKITNIFTFKIKDMKALLNKFFIFHFLVTILLSCSSVPKEYLENDDICHYSDPIFKITKDEMIFDVEKYKDTLEKGDLVLIDNKEIKNEYYKWKGNDNITNSQINKLLNIKKLIKYNKNGKILFSYIKYLNGSSYIGKETEYNQQGNITKVIDYEKGYQICWAEAIEIVKQIAKKDIKKYNVTSFNLLRNDLNEFPNLKPEWDVTLNGNKEYEEKSYSKEGKKIYIIDGVTGKLIKIKKYRMVYDGMVE